MNVAIIYKKNVKDRVLDDFVRELPVIMSDVLEVPGGKVAILKPEQVSLEFTEANPRDIGEDIRIMIFARSNDPRTSSEHVLTQEILDKVVALIAKSGEDCSVNVRLYLMEVGKANHDPGK